MNILDFHFDAMLEHFNAALLEMGAHPEAIAEFIQLLGRIRKYITTGSRPAGVAMMMEECGRWCRHGEDVDGSKGGRAAKGRDVPQPGGKCGDSEDHESNVSAFAGTVMSMVVFL